MKLKTLCLSLITLVGSLGISARAQTYSVIHTFTGPDGAQPEAGVTLRNGVLYGTTRFGGSFSSKISRARSRDPGQFSAQTAISTELRLRVPCSS